MPFAEFFKIKIKKIGFEGNNHLSASKIKKVMETGEWWLFSFMSSSGYYKKDRMEADIDKMTASIDAEVAEAVTFAEASPFPQPEDALILTGTATG
jgi:outer membrane protein assembly factor BamA